MFWYNVEDKDVSMTVPMHLIYGIAHPETRYRGMGIGHWEWRMGRRQRGRGKVREERNSPLLPAPCSLLPLLFYQPQGRIAREVLLNCLF
jgi:hypothetical protein